MFAPIEDMWFHLSKNKSTKNSFTWVTKMGAHRVKNLKPGISERTGDPDWYTGWQKQRHGHRAYFLLDCEVCTVFIFHLRLLQVSDSCYLCVVIVVVMANFGAISATQPHNPNKSFEVLLHFHSSSFMEIVFLIVFDSFESLDYGCFGAWRMMELVPGVRLRG